MKLLVSSCQAKISPKNSSDSSDKRKIAIIKMSKIGRE